MVNYYLRVGLIIDRIINKQFKWHGDNMNNITTNETKTAIAYYRYSSHRQGGQSIEGQRDAAGTSTARHPCPPG